jgi:hypothetical protein
VLCDRFEGVRIPHCEIADQGTKTRVNMVKSANRDTLTGTGQTRDLEKKTCSGDTNAPAPRHLEKTNFQSGVIEPRLQVLEFYTNEAWYPRVPRIDKTTSDHLERGPTTKFFRQFIECSHVGSRSHAAHEQPIVFPRPQGISGS